MQIIYKNIKDINLYDKNPRINDKAVPFVANSIKEFGFKVPIIIDKNNIIVCGHTRYKAAKKLKISNIPCIIADDLTDEQIKAFRLADNKVSELSEWDNELLLDELNSITELNMDLFSFDSIDNDKNIKDVVEDDYNGNIPAVPKSSIGDIYKLGDHFLMCGDSTNLSDVEELMQGNKADLLFTDPPYNINVENSKGMKIKNDNMFDEDFLIFLNQAFNCASNSIKPGGSFYIWYADSETVNFRLACEKNELNIKQTLIWVKNTFNLGRQDYKWQHEPCLYGWKTGSAHYFIEEYNNPTVIDDCVDYKKCKKEELVKILDSIISNNKNTTIIRENKPIVNDLHPTMKPIKMCAKLIKNSSRKNEIVLDLFGGSGSTLIACEQIDRVCYMMEFDPVYVDVIIDRWESFTGDKAQLIKKRGN